MNDCERRKRTCNQSKSNSILNQRIIFTLNEYLYFVAISNWALDKSIAKLRVFPRFYKKKYYPEPFVNPSWTLRVFQDFIKRYYPAPFMVRLQKQHMGITHFNMPSSVYSGFVKYLDENRQYQQYINSLQVYLNAKIFRWMIV